jgi:hypothetical protein
VQTLSAYYPKGVGLDANPAATGIEESSGSGVLLTDTRVLILRLVESLTSIFLANLDFDYNMAYDTVV